MRVILGPMAVSVSEIVQQYVAGNRDFSGVHVEDGADFHDHDLSGAVFRQTRLEGADFRNATLREASFTEAVLTCAKFTGADLTGADFIDATVVDAVFVEDDLSASGLLTRQFAGALLSGTRLPEAISKFDALSTLAESAKNVGTLFLTTLAACVYTLITVATTTDAGLLTNSATSTLPVVSASFPIVGFYYVAPVLLFCLYAYLHLHIQRLFDSMASLPACFPDGNYAHQKVYPTLLNVFAPLFFVRLRHARPPLFWFQVMMVRFLFWGAVPLTLLVLWARYLRRHATLGSLFHTAVFAAVVVLGFLFQRIAFATFLHDPAARRRWPPLKIASVVFGALVVAAMLYANYAVTSGGRPKWLKPSYRPLTPARTETSWPEYARGLAGRLFIADLVDVSFPASTSGDGRGPDLSNLNLRFLRAWRTKMPGALLVNADLTGAELANSDLSRGQLIGATLKDADLKEAKLEKAAISSAVFSGADLSRATLDEAIGSRVYFDHADLTDAGLAAFNCSGCFFRHVTFPVQFDGVYLPRAQFQDATFPTSVFTRGFLAQANFSRVKATGITFEGTVLARADFSGAQMEAATFARQVSLQRARFRGTNLRVADFGHADVRDADFTGADLSGANLAHVRGLTVAQIAGATMDGLTELPPDVQAGIKLQIRRTPSSNTSSRVSNDTTR